MKSKLLLGIMITGILVVTGCTNDTEVVNADDISNSNTIEQNDSLENNQEVIKSNVKEYTAISPSSSEKNVTKQQDDIKIESIPVGSYIKYQPSSTSCTVLAEDSGYENNQTYNPSTITSWKVFKNNNGQLDIISSESVGDLTLQGITGYAKAVDTLNKMCSSYVNSTYADNGRCLGYIESSSVGTIDEQTYPFTYEYTYKHDFPYSDEYFRKDQTVINTKVEDIDLAYYYPLRHKEGHIWLASRSVLAIKNLKNNGGTSFSVRGLSSSGSQNDSTLYYFDLDGSTNSNMQTKGIRPVISLKPRIKITGGEGTKDNPYTISM